MGVAFIGRLEVIPNLRRQIRAAAELHQIAPMSAAVAQRYFQVISQFFHSCFLITSQLFRFYFIPTAFTIQPAKGDVADALTIDNYSSPALSCVFTGFTQ
ncbi:hypothetical protein EEL40_14025 [Muribaculaceae bacterium Isolate-083 (Janvier)]|nr:hypothetical protein EEL37_13320 [Muribaculaceae bacterium Isolate-077 (Janvier)]ROS94267.1 hypothetical protein EEL40_14025 [Muribaculaceae bacterium Isolate-083 (Janvier)]ROS96689.1 hypothetical protein EEL41_13320 [Muribaculaceae bacterium Isolate-084 (Janvier)]